MASALRSAIRFPATQALSANGLRLTSIRLMSSHDDHITKDDPSKLRKQFFREFYDHYVICCHRQIDIYQHHIIWLLGRHMKTPIHIVTKFEEMEKIYLSQNYLRYDVAVDVAPEIKWKTEDAYKNLKCNGLFHERLGKLREEQQHLPLKKGDWICHRCHFMNFARNTRCLQCKKKPAERQLNSGEWECESCNYINFKRNKVCLKCDHRRPKASNGAGFSSRSTKQNRIISRTRPYFGELNEETDEGVDEWELGDSSDYEDHFSSTSGNEVAGFVDFPVLGGSSDLSRDAKKQKWWKREMTVKNRITPKERENAADGLKSSFIHDSQHSQNTGNEEMDEWFGHKNTQNVGNYEACPCYFNLTTHNNTRKCP